MAATWTSTVTVAGPNILRVNSVRTDGEDVRRYSFRARIDPEKITESKAGVLAEAKRRYQADIAKEAAEASIVEGWAEQLDAALNSWEAK